MKCKPGQPLFRYGMTAAAAVFAVWLSLELRGFSLMTGSAERCRALADAFTVPGVTLIMLWILGTVSASGVFDGITYALDCAVRGLLGTGGGKSESYGDYLDRKASVRASGEGFSFLGQVGTVFMIPAAAFTVMFYFY